MKKIDFKAKDGIELNGLLYTSKNKTKEVILSIHGMSSNCLKKREDLISKIANNNNIDYFCFNNRGSELVKYIIKTIDNKKIKLLGGSTYEDVQEGYYDIVGAIELLKSMGYENIYLQGHSLGCTKIVYTYNKLKEEKKLDILNCIKGILLISLIDIPLALKIYLKEKYANYVKIAEEKKEKGLELEIMPQECFIHPISVKTFLRYTKNNKEIDFVNPQKDVKLMKLNNINIPLFMRWGNINEMILQEAKEHADTIRKIIKSKKADINYIDGADHGYYGKEEILANEEINFINKNKN